MALPGHESDSKHLLEAQLRAALDVIPAYTWYANPSGGLTFVNERLSHSLGLPKDHPLRLGIDIGAPWDSHISFLHPDNHEETRRVGQPVCAQARPKLPTRRHGSSCTCGLEYFSHSIFSTKKLIANGAADNADIGGAVDVILREDGALIDEPALDVEKFGGNATIDGVPILVAENDLDWIVDVGRHALMRET